MCGSRYHVDDEMAFNDVVLNATKITIKKSGNSKFPNKLDIYLDGVLRGCIPANSERNKELLSLEGVTCNISGFEAYGFKQYPEVKFKVLI